MNFGRLFKSVRKHLGLTQQEMAEMLGCTQGRLSKIEHGQIEPGAGDLWWLIERTTGLSLKDELTFRLRRDAP